MFDTWECHICGKERDDEFISVFKHDRSEEYKMPYGAFTENVRYCNDDLDCSRAAESYSHFTKDEKKMMSFRKKDDNMLFTFDDDDTLSESEVSKQKPSAISYLVSAIFYFIVFGVAVGSIDAITGGSFIEGAFPSGELWYRWLVRIPFLIYFTVKRPITFLG